MTTVVVTHEVKNGEHWAKAWHKQPGSRHELLAKLGGTARNLRDPEIRIWSALSLKCPTCRR